MVRRRRPALHIDLRAVGSHLADGHLEVGVGGGRRHPQLDGTRPGDHHVRRERVAGELVRNVGCGAGDAEEAGREEGGLSTDKRRRKS